MEEIWKQLMPTRKINADFKDYEVSNLGKVRNIRTHNTLSNFYINKKYLYVRTSVNNVAYTFPLGKLVATTFIPNPENCRFITHIDGNLDNNCVDNLKWSKSNGLKKAKYKNIEMYDKNNNYIETFPTIREIVDKIKKERNQKFIFTTSIYRAINKDLIAYGYKYKIRNIEDNG